MSYGAQPQLVVPPFTKTVKILVIANVVIWMALVLVAQSALGVPVFRYLGLVPSLFIFDFHVWQAATYMFLHSSSVFHILFNMLILWMFGSELELQWGRKFFLSYYLVSGIGAGLLYTFVVFMYRLILDPASTVMEGPVVGASGAVFGLILAYGIVFSERVIMFMGIFPMKSKYFAMILGGIEVVTLMNTGFSSNVANLAHLGGIICGFLYLWFWTRYKSSKPPSKRSGKKHGRNLRLVVNNENPDSSEPRYWN